MGIAEFLAGRSVVGGSFANPLLTVTAATAGNHGRAIAAGAALAGIRCVVFVCDGVSEEQIASIERHGAAIVRVQGVYEAAVAECRARAEQEGWTVVSDTSWTGNEEIPAQVMEGYTVMAAEAFDSAPERPTHAVMQAGVGGMAAAVCAYAAMRYGPHRPKLIVVQPAAAAGLLASAEAGAWRAVPATARTNMGRLECYAPSPIAWDILRGLADAFVAVTDEAATEAVRRLEANNVRTTPSGAAGLAGLAELMGDPRAKAELDLGERSNVLIFITEERGLGSCDVSASDIATSRAATRRSDLARVENTRG